MLKNMGRAAITGLVSIGLGFLVIALAWNGSARVNCVDCQMPYLLSGGALGIGLIAVGTALVFFEAMRRGVAHIEAKFDEVIAAVQAGGTAPANGALSTDTKASRVRAVPPSTNGLVVVGRASFHRPDCRLVQGKEDLDYAPAEDAVARGLNACRVCEPTAVAAR